MVIQIEILVLPAEWEVINFLGFIYFLCSHCVPCSVDQVVVGLINNKEINCFQSEF